jgi:hypothetical protein
LVSPPESQSQIERGTEPNKKAEKATLHHHRTDRGTRKIKRNLVSQSQVTFCVSALAPCSFCISDRGGCSCAVGEGTGEDWIAGVYFLPCALGGDFTLFESHACLPDSLAYLSSRREVEEEGGTGGNREVEHTNPSSNPSPVVAQLGTTNQILSFSCESFRASVTSWGFIATKFDN